VADVKERKGGLMSIGFRVWLLGAVLLSASVAFCATIDQAEWDAMKKEMATLRKDNDDLKMKFAPVKSSVDKALDGKYGPGSAVTKTGKLTISGLVQVWYYSIENDNKQLFEDKVVNNISDTGEALDNDSFRIRRTELKFGVDINQHVKAEIMIDPAREAGSFPGFASNTGASKRGVNGNLTATRSGDAGGPAGNRLLQDAYIHYHGHIPHHDFKIGQFKPPFGEEGIRSSSQLDFIERSFIGQLGDARDLGLSIHGEWWKERFQYWLNVFDSAGNFHGSGGQQQNRSDDNDEKDFGFRVLARPVWNHERWGSLEIGGSSQFGKHGEAAGSNVIDNAVNGLNRNETWAMRHAIWASYKPGGPVRGWWMRGEWAYFKDRHTPSTVIDLLENDLDANGTQDDGNPFSTQGFYVATGYKLMDGRWSEDVPHWMKGFEFTARYDVFQNVQVADLVTPNQTDVFKTQVYTAGINYYIKNQNAKIMLNYNIVDNPEGRDNAGNRNFRQDVKNNSIVVSFQVAF
jgi:hypothetical protein